MFPYTSDDSSQPLHNTTMSLLPAIRPVSVTENKEYGSQYGRSVFAVRSTETNSFEPLFVRNLVSKERESTTSDSVRRVIASIWDTLSLDSCSITPALLRHALDITKSDDCDLGELMRRTNYSLKTIQNAKALSLQPSMKSPNQDALSLLLHSKLGVMMLRHLIDLPWQNMRPMMSDELGSQSIGALNRNFLESPACCLYAKNISCDTVGEIKPTSLYVRTKPQLSFAIPSLLSSASVNLPSEDVLRSFNAGKPDYCYVYGQMMSGYAGCFGNLSVDDNEKAKRRENIQASWAARENFARQSNDQYSAPKWFDSYAGASEIEEATYQIVMSDAPPHSVLSTISAMKRNLLILAYMCQSHMRSSSEMNDIQDTEEMCQDLAEALTRYFLGTNTQFFPTKCPLKVPTSSRCPYLKLQQNVIKKGFSSHRNQSWIGMLSRTGADKEKIARMEKLTEGTYVNLPFTNALSGMNLTERDRLAITESSEESESLIAVAMSLYSYCSLKSGGEPPKIVGGMRTQTSPFQSVVTPLFVCKASLIYGKKLSMEGDGFQVGMNDLERIVKQVEMLCKAGMSKEEAYDVLSLTEEQKEGVRGMQKSGSDMEQPTKRMRTC